MMWPPSCHAASPWNTPTPRTSPSLTKETGWNDGGEGENRRNTGRMEVPHPPAVSHPCTPHLDIKEPKHRYDHLSSLFFFFFVYILSYVCLVVVCVQWRDSTSPLSVFLVFQESFFSLSLFFRIHSSAPTTRLCFGWISCDEIPHVYYRYTRR